MASQMPLTRGDWYDLGRGFQPAKRRMNMTNLKDMSQEQLIALVSKLQAASQRKLTLKVTDKGGVSLYGLGRFPVTLYKSQWERLLGEVEHIRAFLEANDPLLATKE